MLAMPARRRRHTSINPALEEIVSEHVNELVSTLADVIRQQVADEITGFFANGARGRLPAMGRLATVGRKHRSRREMACIAPGCTNTSKGPRFHYLCDKHKDAPKKEYTEWQAARKAKGKKEKASA